MKRFEDGRPSSTPSAELAEEVGHRHRARRAAARAGQDDLARGAGRRRPAPAQPGGLPGRRRRAPARLAARSRSGAGPDAAPSTRAHRAPAYVLTRRYGLEDGEFRTLSEVGKEMGLSRERVRQIEREALTPAARSVGHPRAGRRHGGPRRRRGRPGLNQPAPRCGPSGPAPYRRGRPRFRGRLLSSRIGPGKPHRDPRPIDACHRGARRQHRRGPRGRRHNDVDAVHTAAVGVQVRRPGRRCPPRRPPLDGGRRLGL
jgi:hypothetical protein